MFLAKANCFLSILKLIVVSMKCIQYNILNLLLIKQAQGLASGTNERQVLILRCCLRILYQNNYRNQIVRDVVW